MKIRYISALLILALAVLTGSLLMRIMYLCKKTAGRS